MGTNKMEIYAAAADEWVVLDNNHFFVNHMTDKLLPMDGGKLFRKVSAFFSLLPLKKKLRHFLNEENLYWFKFECSILGMGQIGFISEKLYWQGEIAVRSQILRS